MKSVPFVDLSRQYKSIQKTVDKAIEHVIADLAFIGGRSNSYVTSFEHDWAEYIDADHVIGCANGTDAIELVLDALGIGPGDEVIVPAMTWISTAGAVVRSGAQPIFVDVDPTGTIDPALIENKVGKRTKAIIPVHLYGLPADMNPILQIAARYDLKVIEDSAQAHGATYFGRKTGAIGHAAIFSFYPGKNLGAFGDAGCVATNDSDLAEEIRRIANHGQAKKHDHRRVGRNSRMDGLQAAILSAKLVHLDEWTNLRRAAASVYRKAFLGKDVDLPIEPEGRNHVYHVFQIRSSHHSAEELITMAQANDEIEFGRHYPSALPDLDIFRDSVGEYPQARKIARQAVSLPLFPEISQDELQRTISAFAFLDRVVSD